MTRFLISLLAVAAMAAGCSKNDGGDPAPEPAGGKPIAVCGKALTVSSKAPFEGTIGGANTLTALVLGSQTDGNYTTAYCKGTMTFSDENSTVGYDAGEFTGSKAYPADGSSLYLTGLYPSDGLFSGQSWTAVGTTAAYTFTGVEDVMTAAQVTTDKTKADAGSYETLTFNHRLTLLEVQVVAESESAANAWGKLQEVKLTGAFNNTATVTLATGAAALSGSADGWKIYDAATHAAITGAEIAIPAAEDNSTTDKIKESATKVGYTMVAPITADGTGDFTASITTLPDGGSATTKAGISIDLKNTAGASFTGDTQGKKFVVTLIFRAKDIQAVGSVTDWVAGGSADVDVD